MQLLQNCFISSKLLQNLKFDTVYTNGVALQKIVVYMKFPKEVPVVLLGQMGHFTPTLHPSQQSQACIVLNNFACRVVATYYNM